MRTLPKLKDVVEVIHHPSILCLDCALWSNENGCAHGRDEESTSMAIFGYCGMKKPKGDTK